MIRATYRPSRAIPRDSGCRPPSANNVQEGVDYICNYCSCSCGVLRGITQYGSLNAVARSDFFVTLDEILCTGCEVCVDRCQFHALSFKDGLCHVDLNYCFGCGVCVSTCPSGALQLRQKSGSEIEAPPVSEKEWRQLRTEAREKDGK